MSSSHPRKMASAERKSEKLKPFDFASLNFP